MATKKPKGLGLGLEALLGPRVDERVPAEADAAPRELPVDRLQPGRYQPRTRMDEGALHELLPACVELANLLEPGDDAAASEPAGEPSSVSRDGRDLAE